jgi:hypothetical protein
VQFKDLDLDKNLFDNNLVPDWNTVNIFHKR